MDNLLAALVGTVIHAGIFRMLVLALYIWIVLVAALWLWRKI